MTSNAEEGDSAAAEGGGEDDGAAAASAAEPAVPAEHEGSAFFALPDGTSVLYKLIGTADPLTTQIPIFESLNPK